MKGKFPILHLLYNHGEQAQLLQALSCGGCPNMLFRSKDLSFETTLDEMQESR